MQKKPTQRRYANFSAYLSPQSKAAIKLLAALDRKSQGDLLDAIVTKAAAERGLVLPA